nr:xylulose kinase-1 [Tanacetum cinerariifolium]
MAVSFPFAMPSGLSASMAEVAAMSDSAFHKWFMSSYEIKDSEEDDDKEDEEIEESSDSDSVSEDIEDEGPTIKDEDPITGDEGLVAGVEGSRTDDERHGMDDESRGLDDEGHSVVSNRLGLEQEEEAVPRALRRRELALKDDRVYSKFDAEQSSGSAPEFKRPKRASESRQPHLPHGQTRRTTTPSPEWTSGSIPISPSPSVVPLLVSSPIIDVLSYPPPAPPVQTPPSPKWTSSSIPISPSPSIVPLLVSSPMIPLTGGLIHDHAIQLEELPPALFKRSLEHKQERTAMTFKALWRPVLVLEAWAGRVDTWMTDMLRAGYDDHRLVHDMLIQHTTLQRELQEMRGRVTMLKQERDHRERSEGYVYPNIYVVIGSEWMGTPTQYLCSYWTGWVRLPSICVVIREDGYAYPETTAGSRLMLLGKVDTVAEVMARERERKARTTLLMALQEDHLAKFHKMADAKEMWEAIKSRFGARDNGRRPVYQDDSKDLVTINEEDIEWFRHVEEDTQNYAMMVYSFSNSGSDNE